MEKVFHNNENGTLNVSCTYAQEEYSPIIDKVVDNLIKNVIVKGFRKGKAPREMAIRQVKNEDIYNGLVKKLIDKDFDKLLDGYKGVDAVASIRPKLSIDFDQKKKEYNLLYTFVFLPYCKVKKTSGYEVSLETKKVLKKNVDEAIEKLLVDNAELVPSKEAAEKNDHVIIDFIGYIDGKEFDGGSAKDYDLTIGSNSFVPGFEDELIGIKEGEKRTIEITFPKNYLASLADKKAKFAVTCKTVKKIVKPEANDEFAKELQDYKVETFAELEEAVKTKLKDTAKANAKNAKLNKIFQLIEKDAKPVIAKEYLELASNKVQEEQLAQFKQYGLNLEEYLKITGITDEQFKKNCESQAAQQASQYAVVKGVAQAAKIAVEEDDLVKRFGGKEKYDELMTAAKKQSEANTNFNVDQYMENIKESILIEKVNDYLLNNNQKRVKTNKNKGFGFSETFLKFLKQKH